MDIYYDEHLHSGLLEQDDYEGEAENENERKDCKSS